jgi:oxygen-independent coproporphyrinogen-3 oxidase
MHYEVSAYAKPAQYARHNLNYWQFGDYLGIGAGAHSKISFAHRIIRQTRYKHPQTYLNHCQAGHPIQEEKEISLQELPFEFMLNALRLSDGFEISQFTERTGLSMQAIEMPLQKACERGLLTHDHGMITPTSLGRRFLNDLQSLFLRNST